VLAGTASAADTPMLDDFSFNVGLFANSANSQVTVNSGSNAGSTIDLKNDLGMDGTRSLPYISLSWRPWERHEFEFSYFSDDQSNTRTLSRDITIRDDVYKAGAQISSKLSYQAYGFDYRYWLWIGDKASFGVGGGLQAYSFDLKLNGTAQITGPNGGPSTSANRTAKASTDIPDPSLGISYRYQAADWARFVADGGAFKINVGNIDATLYNARFGMEFYPWQNFGIVTQYQYNKIKAELTKDDYNGRADFKFSGFQVLARFRF
jgi:hypothetical protein